MTSTALHTNLEFLAKFFSEPDNDLIELIRLGKTPLGIIEKSDSDFSYADEKMVLITDIFVNSRNARPIFPLATEYLSDKIDKEKFLDKLVTYYALDNKVSTNYPPDHLKVLIEFILFKLSQDDIVGGKDFYTIFLKPWYNSFTDAIQNRTGDLLGVGLAVLINKTMVQIEEL